MNGFMQVAGCKNDNCPKVHVDGDTARVQGIHSTGPEDMPADEAVVEIPLDVLKEAAKEVLREQPA